MWPRQYPPANRSAPRVPRKPISVPPGPHQIKPPRWHGPRQKTRARRGRGAGCRPVRPGRTCTGSAIWMYADGRRRVDPVNGAARAGGRLGGEAAASPASREKLAANELGSSVPGFAPRNGTERIGRPPAGRWGLGASGRQATCRSWTLTGSAPSRGRSPRARAWMESCGCGRGR